VPPLRWIDAHPGTAHTSSTAASRSTGQVCPMNAQLLPRTTPMLMRAYPDCALRLPRRLLRLNPTPYNRAAYHRSQLPCPPHRSRKPCKRLP
jgi:hypothetical protein